jgi:hypothetical protein
MTENIVLRLQECENRDFGGQGCSFDVNSMLSASTGDVPVIDAAFVDDEALAILARSPCQLDKAVNKMLEHLVRICSQMRLDINWNPGKTEAFLRYRGKGAVKRLELKRRADGSLAYPIPGTQMQVNIVDHYKHLGGVVCSDGNVQLDAVVKARSATTAYIPIAGKIFGAAVLGCGLRINFLWSLVMSRLLFNVHILVPTNRFVKVLNFVYMRVLRRIAGCVRFSHCESDYEVRRRLKMPSLQCILAKARLRYMRRIIIRQPQVLLALLAVRCNGRKLPWVSLVIEDMRALRKVVSICSGMPDPDCDPSPWIALMRTATEWSTALACFCYCESHIEVDGCQHNTRAHGSVDANSLASTVRIPSHAGYTCDVCQGVFASMKALLAHQRAAHQHRVEQRYFSNSRGICQVCGTLFHTHARLLRHLTDRRRTKCWTAIRNSVSEFERLAESQVQELDAWQREQKRLAYRAGHSQIIAAKPAKTSTGKAIGHVRR